MLAVEICFFNDKIVKRSYFAVAVNVGTGEFFKVEIRKLEIYFLDDCIVEHIHLAVAVYVAFCKLSLGLAAKLYVTINDVFADKKVFLVNRFAVFGNTKQVFTRRNVRERAFCFTVKGLFAGGLFLTVRVKRNVNFIAFFSLCYSDAYAGFNVAQTAIHAYSAFFANVCFREANKAGSAVPFIVELFCKTFFASAAGLAIFITKTVRAFHTVPAGIVFSAVKFKTVTAFNAVTFIFKSAIPALMADVAIVVGAITAFSASYAFVINIIASLAIGAVRSAYNPAVGTIIPALGAHFGAVFAKIAI